MGFVIIEYQVVGESIILVGFEKICAQVSSFDPHELRHYIYCFVYIYMVTKKLYAYISCKIKHESELSYIDSN